jgi:large subunit ribosomal protein L6
MSRIGKKPIPLPAKVEVKIDGQDVTVKGPKGTLTHTVHPAISVALEGKDIVVTRGTDERQDRALHGLTRALLANMVTGVSTGFRRELLIEGVGYTAEMRGKDLVMKLGFSHEVVVNPPENVTFSTEGRQKIIVDGIDKQVVGQVASDIRGWRPPEPYLGKGVRYAGEIIRRKAGKTGK